MWPNVQPRTVLVVWLSNATPQLLMQKGDFSAQFHPPLILQDRKLMSPSSPIVQLLSCPFLEKELKGSLAEWTICSLRPCPSPRNIAPD
jgi:hypothetical protein